MLAYKDAILAFALFYPTVEFLGVAAIALILWVGGISIFADTLTLGVLVAFMQYAQRFFRPIQDLSEKFNILQSAMAASERIFRLLDEPVTHLRATRRPFRCVNRAAKSNFAMCGSLTGMREPKEEDWVLRDVSFQSGARPDHGDRGPHRRGKDHAYFRCCCVSTIFSADRFCSTG